jgi:DNA repair photolyase
MPFAYTLNPYRGCTHACEYCFARRYQAHFELDAGDAFSSVIFIKANFLDVLRRELAAPGWTRAQVALGTATDPYQPIEGTYRLSRGTLEALLAARTPVGLVTKGPMVVRDTDVLADLAAHGLVRVYVSVPSIDEEAWALLEPGTASPMQRLRAVRALRDAGVPCGVLMAPIVPGFTSHPRRIADTFEAAVDHGAAFVGANVMYLKDGTRDHFFAWLRAHAPELVARYQRLYVRTRVPKAYADEVAAIVDVLQRRHGLVRDDETSPIRGADGSPARPDQASTPQPRLDWDTPDLA